MSPNISNRGLILLWSVFAIITIVIIIIYKVDCMYDYKGTLCNCTVPSYNKQSYSNTTGWLMYDNKWYYFSLMSGNWHIARHDCKTRNAILVSIYSHDMLSFLSRIDNHYPRWIGLTRTHDRWYWETGNVFIANSGLTLPTYTNENHMYISAGGSIAPGTEYEENRWICVKE